MANYITFHRQIIGLFTSPLVYILSIISMEWIVRNAYEFQNEKEDLRIHECTQFYIDNRDIYTYI